MRANTLVLCKLKAVVDQGEDGQYLNELLEAQPLPDQDLQERWPSRCHGALQGPCQCTGRAPGA